MFYVIVIAVAVAIVVGAAAVFAVFFLFGAFTYASDIFKVVHWD